MPPKANLVVQNTYHPVDSHHLTVDDQIHDLVLTDAGVTYHTHVSQDLRGNSDLDLNLYDLLSLNSSHDHTSHHIYRFVGKQNLAMQDAYHVLTDADAAVIPLYEINLGQWPDYTRKLPTILFEGSFGHRLRWGENKKLPTVGIENARTGFRTGVDTEGVETALKLPTVSSEGLALMGANMTLDAKLPAVVEYVDWDMRLASNFTGKLPAILVEAEASGGLWGRVDATLPGIECVAAAWRPVGMWLDAKLPPLSIDTSQSIELYPWLDRKLPTLLLEAYCYGGPGAVLDATLPPVRMLADDAEGTSGDVFTLDATLPAVVMRPVGTGSGVDGEAGVIQDETRYEDYVLRYARSG